MKKPALFFFFFFFFFRLCLYIIYTFLHISGTLNVNEFIQVHENFYSWCKEDEQKKTWIHYPTNPKTAAGGI